VKRVLLCGLLVAACSRHRTVDLGFDETGAFFGFRCRQPGTDTAYAARGFIGGRFVACVYFDFVQLPGIPVCGPSGLVDYCETHDCVPLTDPLVAPIQIDEPAPTPGSAQDFVNAQIRALDGRVLIDDGPAGPLLIRGVVVAGRCKDAPPYRPHDPGAVMGCAVSCPLELDTVDGEIPFGLPSLTDDCTTSVLACASDRLTP
jgi:hypothetical protein